AGEVAAAVAGLRAAAEDRAKRAELDRAKAEVQAAEQRKRRRVQLMLAGAVALALLAVVGGLAAYLVTQSRANADLEAKDEEWRQANERESAARSEAEGNFELAYTAVEQSLYNISEDDRLKEHDLFELRRSLSATAKDFFIRFAARSRDDPKLALALGRA